MIASDARKDGSRWMVSRRSIDAAKASSPIIGNTQTGLSADA